MLMLTGYMLFPFYDELFSFIYNNQDFNIRGGESMWFKRRVLSDFTSQRRRLVSLETQKIKIICEVTIRRELSCRFHLGVDSLSKK